MKFLMSILFALSSWGLRILPFVLTLYGVWLIEAAVYATFGAMLMQVFTTGLVAFVGFGALFFLSAAFISVKK
jgi:hypothetical protein